MKYRQGKIIIPEWISCRTYLFGETESRTYISNERAHSYVLLEGLSSDMWKLLCDSVSEDFFDGWAAENGVSDQAEDFLRELSDNGLIITENEEIKERQALYEEISAESDGESEFIEEMQTWLFQKKFMFSIFFELTYRCNLKCVHCYNPKDTAVIELDFDKCKKAIDDAYEAGCFKVTFSGGESTLHSRFFELVKYARDKRMSVEIFTNGQLLAVNERLYYDLINLYPYRICVSLYGTDKRSHEQVTDVDGSFEKTYSLIKRLRKDNVNVQIKNFLLNINCFECIKVKKFAEEVKATSVADVSLIPTIEGDKKTLRYMLDGDTLFKLYTDERSPLYIDINKFKLNDFDEMKDGSPCLGGFTGLCVNPTGEVVICVSMPLSVGNLNDSSIKEIWTAAMNKKAGSKLYEWQRVTLKDFTECFKYEYCKFCRLCPGMGYLENGYLKKSDVLCVQAKAKMKAYNYLKKK